MTDKDLKQHVQNALDWEPSVDATDIGVSVDDGVVTLRGNVGSYMEKLMAERVALRVTARKRSPTISSCIWRAATSAPTRRSRTQRSPP